MTDAFHPSSTFVDIDVLDVATPVWTPGQQTQTQVSNYPYTPIQSTALQSRTHVQFVPSTLSPNTPVQPLVWDGNHDQMQLCTPSPAGTVADGSQVSSGAQYELPRTVPTPAREIGYLTTQVQGNRDKLFDLLENQEAAVSVLTSELKQSSSQHESQLKGLADKVDKHTQQISKILSDNKQQTETETDQMVKTMKLLITDELQENEKSLVSNIRFMVDNFKKKSTKTSKLSKQTFKKVTMKLLKFFTLDLSA